MVEVTRWALPRVASTFEGLHDFCLLAIPLFILMGQIAFNAGIAKRLYNAADKFIGHVPGGLAMATVAGATAFKAICGSGPATAATFASVAVPEMDVKPVRQRYTCLHESSEGGLYKYEGLGTGFEAHLPVDDVGLVLDYPGLCRRLWAG